MSRLTGKVALVVGGATVDPEYAGTGCATAIPLAPASRIMRLGTYGE